MSRSQTSFTGSIVTFSVPTTGFYDIVAHQLNDPESGAEATKKNSSSRASLVHGVRKSHLSSWKEFMERPVPCRCLVCHIALRRSCPRCHFARRIRRARALQGVGGPEVTCTGDQSNGVIGGVDFPLNTTASLIVKD